MQRVKDVKVVLGKPQKKYLFLAARPLSGGGGKGLANKKTKKYVFNFFF